MVNFDIFLNVEKSIELDQSIFNFFGTIQKFALIIVNFFENLNVGKKLT